MYLIDPQHKKIWCMWGDIHIRRWDKEGTTNNRGDVTQPEHKINTSAGKLNPKMDETLADCAVKQRKKCNKSHVFYSALTKGFLAKEAKCFHGWLFRVALLLGRYSNPQDSACSHSPGTPGRPISLGWWTRVEEAIFSITSSLSLRAVFKGVSRTIKIGLLLMKQRWMCLSIWMCVYQSQSDLFAWRWKINFKLSGFIVSSSALHILMYCFPEPKDCFGSFQCCISFTPRFCVHWVFAACINKPAIRHISVFLR